MSNYQTNALRTAPTDNDAIRKRLDDGEIGDSLRNLLDQFMQAAISLDAFKKYFFYGRPIAWDDNAERELALTQDALIYEDLVPTDSNIQLLHGVLGKITEAAELFAAVAPAIFGGNMINFTNVGEEIGDSRWYDAVIADATGQDLDDIDTRNIAKLRARFPERFTEEKANHRNLDAEQSALEG